MKDPFYRNTHDLTFLPFPSSYGNEITFHKKMEMEEVRRTLKENIKSPPLPRYSGVPEEKQFEILDKLADIYMEEIISSVRTAAKNGQGCICIDVQPYDFSGFTKVHEEGCFRRMRGEKKVTARDSFLLMVRRYKFRHPEWKDLKIILHPFQFKGMNTDIRLIIHLL